MAGTWHSHEDYNPATDCCYLCATRPICWGQNCKDHGHWFCHKCYEKLHHLGEHGISQNLCKEDCKPASEYTQLIATCEEEHGPAPELPALNADDSEEESESEEESKTPQEIDG